MVIYIYKHECQLGDYVFADGTSSDINNKLKTIVGICFYINPENKSQRLCVFLQTLESGTWGFQNDANNGSNGFSEIKLSDTPGYSVFDVPTLSNINLNGLDNGYINEASYKDESGKGDVDGFKIFAAGTAMAELGWEEIPIPLGNYPQGAKLPIGLINTLKIITHRNIILSDSNINRQLPVKTGSISELENLQQLISDIVTENGNQSKYRQFYYPAASLCNSFEPEVKKGEVLTDCFKAGKWFLPSCGELGRIYWYHRKGYEVKNPEAIFAKAVAEGKMSQITNAYYWSSTERNMNLAWLIGFSDGLVSNTGNKWPPYPVLAVAAF